MQRQEATSSAVSPIGQGECPPRHSRARQDREWRVRCRICGRLWHELRGGGRPWIPCRCRLGMWTETRRGG
jgi:hypothetical protein